VKTELFSIRSNDYCPCFAVGNNQPIWSNYAVFSFLTRSHPVKIAAEKCRSNEWLAEKVGHKYSDYLII